MSKYIAPHELQDGEYYWIAYQFPSADDEIWAIGIYCEKFGHFQLCGRTIITLEYVIETQVVERPI